jgi:hypothetical protein
MYSISEVQEMMKLAGNAQKTVTPSAFSEEQKEELR